MAVVTPARLGQLRLNAGRLAYVAPTVPHTPNPPHQSIAGPLAVSWQCTPATYSVYFGTTTTPPLVGTTTSLGWLTPPLTIGTVYYWRVTATNALGTSNGPLWSFTAAQPVAPVYVSPPNHSTNQATAVTLVWTHPLVVPGDVVFDVHFGPTPSAPLVSARQAERTYTPATLQDGIDYYWRIVARNNVGTATGPTWTFETRNPTKGLITIGGVDVRGRVRIADISIRDQLADVPNTCQFTIDGTAPTIAAEVRVGLASLAGDDVIFGGYLDTVESLYEGMPANRAWRVTCQDYVYGINRRKVRIRYGQQSATIIGIDLVTKFAPAGYTTTFIQAGLPIVEGGIDFTEEDLTARFARLAQRIGGYWYVDYDKAVHLFVTESADAPLPITAAGRVLLNEPPITWDADLTQIRTRVYVEGGGSEARAVVAVGAISLPVVDASWYSPTGGLVVSGPQRIRYTGKGTVGGPAMPTATGQSIPGNLSGGPYTYVVTQITAGAESPLSPPSTPPVLLPAVASPPQTLVATPVFGAVPAPATAPTPTPVNTQVIAPATAPTATSVNTQVPPPASAPTVTSQSTRVAPPASALTLTPGGTGIIPAPTQPPTLSHEQPGPVPPGLFYYAYTYFNGVGETTISPTSWVDFGANYSVLVICPASPSPGITQTYVYRSDASGNGLYLAGVINGNGGSVADRYDVFGRTAPTTNTTGISGALVPGGTYHWKVKFVTATGETVPGVDSATTLPTIYNGVLLSNVPTSADGRVVKRRIYRTKANALDNMYFEAEITDNVTTTFASKKADSALGAVMSVADSTGTGSLVPGGSYTWLVTFGTSTGETTEGASWTNWIVITADTALLSNVPISPDTRVNKRKVYRYLAGAWKLDGTIADNTTTTYTSSKADASLGAAIPTSNTTHGSGSLVMGGWYAWAVTFVSSKGETLRGPYAGITPMPTYDNVASLTAIPTSPDARVIARRIYRTKHGGGPFFLDATINDNTTTTFTSTKSDTALGAGEPTTNTTGTGGLIPGYGYTWLVTYVTAQGETTNGPWSTLWLTMPAGHDTVNLTNIPTSGDVRVTRRRLYRANLETGILWRLEATINDNVTTTFTSVKAEGALGTETFPPTNTTGTGGLVPGVQYAWTVKYVTASGESGEMPGVYLTMPTSSGYDAAQLSGIPVSTDPRVTKRKVYRLVVNTSTYRFEVELADNVTTTYISVKRDDQLGADMVWGNSTSAVGQIAVSSIALGGGTTTARKLYRTQSGGAAFLLVATINDNTTTTYQDNKSDASLGALAPVDLVTELIGIPATGDESIRYEIRQGDEVNILVQCDATAAQAALAALEGGGSTGIVEHYIRDNRLALNTATATGNADLTLFSRPLVTVHYATRDPKTRSGKTVTIDLPELSLDGEFTIQTVEIDEIDRAPGLYPRYTVTASSVRFSLEDVIRRLQLET